MGEILPKKRNYKEYMISSKIFFINQKAPYIKFKDLERRNININSKKRQHVALHAH